MNYLKCIECGKEYPNTEVLYTCECGGLLDVIYDYSRIDFTLDDLKGIPLSVWKYRKLLPFEGEATSLQEGGTPLYKCDRLAKKIGIKELYVKHEGMNPTGSFKDRGMTGGVTKALELGMKTLACASTGNTAAAISTYSAKAGVPAVILLPEGKVALGKLGQALIHGAKVISIKGNFDDALRLVKQLCYEEGFYLLNSLNPYRLEGQKTIAFEMVEQMNMRVPDRVLVPMGNAGNITAIHKGFKEFMKVGITEKVPKMIGIQPEGVCPIVKAFRAGTDEIIPEKNPETIATAIRIGNPVNAKKALRAISESEGMAESVTDEEIIEAQKELAQLEGIGVEPASATSIAGLKKLVKNGIIGTDETITCITTGHLLKDPEEVISVSSKSIVVDAAVEDIRRVLYK
ncbi:threonine synthase [Methanohalophilus sp.]|uniref:threonine synthase n=1 Tax=Methanohalophilus sp. TaxID=1966352 RepID=UPI00262A20A2|nr:threonine synthase [Methanohalophilus sp.]MDK2893138.1 threonine synthase [Methanohalophilus sp.]